MAVGGDMDNEMTYLAILGFIETLPEHDKEEVRACLEKLRDILSVYPEHGKLALALLGAEFAKDSTG